MLSLKSWYTHNNTHVLYCIRGLLPQSSASMCVYMLIFSCGRGWFLEDSLAPPQKSKSHSPLISKLLTDVKLWYLDMDTMILVKSLIDLKMYTTVYLPPSDKTVGVIFAYSHDWILESFVPHSARYWLILSMIWIHVPSFKLGELRLQTLLSCCFHILH